MPHMIASEVTARGAAADVDVLIPTCARTGALSITLSTLAFQDCKGFRIIISEQGDGFEAGRSGEVKAVVRLLEFHGCPVQIHHHVPRRGMAEQRQFLLDRSDASCCLFLDDDVMLEPDLIGRMRKTLGEERCGFVGCALIGLSYLHDVRPYEQHIEFWDGPVQPEDVRPRTAAWERYKLHNAANILHVQQKLALPAGVQKKYRVAWIGGCVMYDRRKLVDAGGFQFWKELPPVHCGEDVEAQQRVMRRYGGCAIIPSGVYHQELPTTLPDRTTIAPLVFNNK